MDKPFYKEGKLFFYASCNKSPGNATNDIRTYTVHKILTKECIDDL